MSDGLLHGSIVVIFFWLIIGGLGIPLPEDAALLAAGVLMQRGVVEPVFVFPIVFVGVVGGDALLFFLARRLGPAAYERTVFRRMLPPARRVKIERAYRRYGGWLVFGARHVVGLRAAVFAMAGIHGMRPSRFLLWDSAAACMSVPLVVMLGYLGATHVDRMRAGIADARLAGLLAMVLGALGYLTWRKWRASHC